MLKQHKKRTVKKACCLLTAGMMAFSAGVLFTGCSGKNENAVVNQQEAMKSLAYKVSSLNISQDIGSDIVSKNGLLYSTAYNYYMKDDMYYTNTYIVAFDKTGTIKQSIKIYEQTVPNEYCNLMGGINVDDSGNISCMLSKSSYNEETGESKQSNELITYDASGNIINTLSLDQIISEDEMNNGNMWFQNYVMDGQGNIYCNLNSCVRVLDSTGKILFTTEKLDSNNAWMNGMITTNQGVPAVFVYEYSEAEEKSTNKLVEIDINTKSYGKEHILKNNSGQMYSGSGDYLCYTSTDTGIMGIRADDLTVEPVLNLLNLGVDNSQINSFTICDDGSFITTGYNYTGYTANSCINFIEPVDASQVKEKKVISLGCFYLDWNIRQSIADFNKTNEEYIISVDSYSETNDTSDWDAALTKFNNELLAGNIPDILLINSNMPFDSYAEKGMFTDMYTLMEADGTYTKDAFMPNVLAAGERDGKLLAISPGFNVSSYAAKTSLVGNETSISVDKANQLLAGMEEGATLTNYMMTQTEYLSSAVYYGSFVDYINGICNFDTPEFKAILETAKTYPKEIDYDALYNENPNYWMEQETACRDNRALLYSAYLYDFESFNRIEKGYFGEDVTYVGFPGGDSNSSLLNFNSQVSISEKSAFKDGAWQFIKYMLDNSVTQEEVINYAYEVMTEDTQADTDVGSFEVNSTILSDGSDENAPEKTGEMRWVVRDGNFPVLIEQLNNVGKQATIPRTYKNENGETVEEENIYYIGNEEVKFPYMTQAEVDECIAFLKTVTKVQRYDTNIDNIINEEAALFFDGSKSVDETAAIIQSRASIYMSEQY